MEVLKCMERMAESMVAQFFYGAGGVLAGYVIIGLAAALGNLVGGALLRFQFEEFIFFMVRVGKKRRGVSVGLCDPQGYISCQMIDTKDTKMRNLIYGAFSMAMAIFFTETVCIQLFGTKYLPSNAFTLPMAVVMILYTLFLIIRLGVTQKKKTGNDAAGTMRREYERAYAALKAGTLFAELSMEQVSYTGKLTDLPIYKKYLMMNYYHFLDAGDYGNVGKVMDELENYVPDKWSQSELGMLAEFVFYYVIIAPNEGRAKFYGKTFTSKLDGNEGVNAKRAFAYWLFFMEGNKGAALQIVIEAMKAVRNERIAGCQTMERRLLEALMKRIENTP